MADTPTAHTGDGVQDGVAERGLPAALAIVVATALIQPRALPALIGLLAVILAGVAWFRRDRLRFEPSGAAGAPFLTNVWRAQPTTVAFLAFAAYCAITAIWSPVPVAALGKAAWLVLLVLMAAIGVQLWAASDDEFRIRLLKFVAVAVVLGSVFAAIEVWTGTAITRFVYNTVPFMNPGPNKHMVHDKGLVVHIGPYVMNRNLGALNMLLWPALLCVIVLGQVRGVLGQDRGRFTPKQAAILAIVLFAATLAATLPSEHESSQIAIVLATVIFLLAHWSLSVARNVVLTGWIVAVLGMLPVVALAHHADLHRNRMIPDTGQARIILWNFTAHKFLERPLLGVGANATRSIDEDLKPTAKAVPGNPYPERTGQHAHNFFVQIWFELGAIGALLFLGCGLQLWRAIGRLHTVAQPYALAACTSAMCIASLTWGFWQQWYLSLFAVAILLTALGHGALAGSSAGGPSKEATHDFA